jgi:GH18 family chitinase
MLAFRKNTRTKSSVPHSFFIILLAIFCSSKNLLAQTCKQVIGYYPNWQWYDRNKLVNPQTIDYSKYSIINYSFFAPQTDGSLQSTDSWADENLLLGEINWATGGYYPNTSIIDLAHNNGVKVLAAIGGWTLSDNFPGIAADPVKRSTFVQACIDLIQQYNFDGIDIDWEYPGYAGHSGTPQDKNNFTLLLQELRTSLDTFAQNHNLPTMLITACVSADRSKMDDIDWQGISQPLDAINLMSYDFFGAWDGYNNHNSPLHAPLQGNPHFCISAAVDRLINHYGVDPQKLNAGVAFYGRSQISNSTPTLYGAGLGQGDNITFAADQGTPLYYNVVANAALFDRYWDAAAEVPYLIGKNGLNTFLSYDDEESIALKADFIVQHNLQGAIIWEITGDYLETTPGSGIIAATPLVDTLNAVFCDSSSNTILAVDILDFQAYQNDQKQLMISWTKKELGNLKEFRLEHSTNSIDFNEIDRQNAQHTNKNQYSFWHQNPQEGINYYRLKQLDANGKTAYSSTIAYAYKSPKHLLELQPNPAFDQLIVHLNTDTPLEAAIEIFNSYGQTLILSETIFWSEGMNTVAIDLDELPKGIYWLSIAYPAGAIIRKFVKQ